MWVKMSILAYRATLKAVVFDEQIYNALQVEVQETPARMIVCAPYAAWHFARQRLFKTTLGPRGGRGPQSGFSALRNITRELNYVDTHPALQGAGMIGTHHDLFPAWKIDEYNGRQYSPYPQPGHQFVVLTPVWRRPGSREALTWWVEKPSAEWRLADESLHLALWRRVVR